MNLRMIIKKHAADLEIGFLKKSISKPYGHATAMPTAWNLSLPMTGRALHFPPSSQN